MITVYPCLASCAVDGVHDALVAVELGLEARPRCPPGGAGGAGGGRGAAAAGARGGPEAVLVVEEVGGRDVEVRGGLVLGDLGEELALGAAGPGSVALGGRDAHVLERDLGGEQAAWPVGQFAGKGSAQHPQGDGAGGGRGGAEAPGRGGPGPDPAPRGTP